MNGPYQDEEQEKPLDPAVEKVRRRLVRFVAINLGLLFLALMAVVVAIVYRANQVSEPMPPEVAEIPGLTDGAILEDRIELPAGARIAGHSLSGTRFSMIAELSSGERQIVVYDMAARRVIARISVAAAGP